MFAGTVSLKVALMQADNFKRTITTGKPCKIMSPCSNSYVKSSINVMTTLYFQHFVSCFLSRVQNRLFNIAFCSTLSCILFCWLALLRRHKSCLEIWPCIGTPKLSTSFVKLFYFKSFIELTVYGMCLVKMLSIGIQNYLLQSTCICVLSVSVSIKKNLSLNYFRFCIKKN